MRVGSRLATVKSSQSLLAGVIADFGRLEH